MRKGLLWVLIAMVVLAFSAGGYAIGEAHKAADRATFAVCALKASYARQLETTEDYLRDPVKMDKAVKLGFTRADIVSQRDSLRLRVKDLRAVSC